MSKSGRKNTTKGKHYNCPPRMPRVRCPMCYRMVGEGRAFYNHVASSCKLRDQKD